VEAAKQLMTVRGLPLSKIAISAGFANQSHFTRVFLAAVGVSPGAWRREAHGAPEEGRNSGQSRALGRSTELARTFDGDQQLLLSARQRWTWA